MLGYRIALRSALVVALTSAAVPAAASAAPGWAPAVTFGVPGNAFGGQDEVRYQNGGIATEAFLELASEVPLRTQVHVGTVAPGGSYTDQLVIPSSLEAIPAGVQIAVAGNGAAVAGWVELLGAEPETSFYRYRAAYRPAGSGTWEAPFTIATDTERNKEIYAYLTPVIGADGTAAVGVQHIASGETAVGRGEPKYRVDVAGHRPSGGWQAPTRLSLVDISAESLALSLDGQGDVTAAYAQRFSEGGTPKTEDDRTTLIVRRLPAASDLWGPEEDITGSSPTHQVDALHLGENEAGDAVLAYQYVEGKTFNVWAVTRQGAKGKWTKPVAELVNGGAGGSSPEAAGVAPNGRAYVLYRFAGNSSGESCAGVVRGPVVGSFSAPECVSPTNEDVFSGSIAFLGNDAYFAWHSEVPGAKPPEQSIQGARWADGTALPDVATNLDTPNLTYGFPTLVNDHQGSVVAFYTDKTNRLRAAAYDAGPPILLSAGVPSSATAGAPVGFSAAFVDLWSALGTGQPTWSFGDGTPSASGTSVKHTFSAPGVYTVTLSSSDALGNTTSSTYTVPVAPAPSAATPAPIDTQAPRVTLNTPKCRRKLSKRACARRRASRKAWQTLTGTVSDPAPSSGIASVQVAVYLTHGKRVEGLVGTRFRKTRRTKARKTFVTAKVSGRKWSLRLPKLKAGFYTILLRATDRAGHVSGTVTKSLRLR
jgi:PKD domain